MVGETLMVALSAIAIGDTIITDGASPNAAVTKLSDKLIKDVQINGSSILNNGVANVPMAAYGSPGVTFVQGDGLLINSAGRMMTDPAPDDVVKAGTNAYRPIAPYRQHQSIYYGLAKLAGADMASLSGETIGVYPEAQKVAIQKMLGVYNEWELIAEVTTTENLDTVEISTDINGQPFELREMLTRVKLQPSTTGTQDYVLGRTVYKARNGNIYNTGPLSTLKYTSTTGTVIFEYKHKLIDGFCYIQSRASAGEGSTTNIQGMSFPEINVANQWWISSVNGIVLAKYNSTTTPIPAGSIIKIYGIRV